MNCQVQEIFLEEEEAESSTGRRKVAKISYLSEREMHMVRDDVAIIDAHCEKVEKAYPAYFDTYAQMDELIPWLDSTKNLYCIGRNGQHRYNNMDHSMLTVMEAVEHLLKRSNEDRACIWNVNTEQSYHEQQEEKE